MTIALRVILDAFPQTMGDTMSEMKYVVCADHNVTVEAEGNGITLSLPFTGPKSRTAKHKMDDGTTVYTDYVTLRGFKGGYTVNDFGKRTQFFVTAEVTRRPMTDEIALRVQADIDKRKAKFLAWCKEFSIGPDDKKSMAMYARAEKM